ncbi:hypothetical protein [Agrilutibacter niabensis]|uniref:hypothetical protein n=1 Tax=Agrilutibacter niabensis TaxID=380628 RepID=UPI003D2F7E82
MLDPVAMKADRKLRSFTARGAEAFGAGHNALGAWRMALAGRNRAIGRLEYGEDVLAGDRTLGVASAQVMTQCQPEFLAKAQDLAELAVALGIDPQDICAPSPQVVSTGAPHLLVAVHERADVDKARPDSQRLLAQLRGAGWRGLLPLLDGAPRRRPHCVRPVFQPHRRLVGGLGDGHRGRHRSQLSSIPIAWSQQIDRSSLSRADTWAALAGETSISRTV